MRFIGKLALSAAALSMFAAPVSAQAWKWDFGVNGGWSTFTKMLSEEDTGLLEENPGSAIKFSSGGMLGTQLTFWPGAKFGVRANLRYADRAVKGNDMEEDFRFVEHVNLWGGTVDLMFRFKAPAEEFTK